MLERVCGVCGCVRVGGGVCGSISMCVCLYQCLSMSAKSVCAVVCLCMSECRYSYFSLVDCLSVCFFGRVETLGIFMKKQKD